jgi:hypothetical protein
MRRIAVASLLLALFTAGTLPVHAVRSVFPTVPQVPIVRPPTPPKIPGPPVLQPPVTLPGPLPPSITPRQPSLEAGSDDDVMRRIQQAHRFAKLQGAVAGLPTFHCKDYDSDDGYWVRPRCGTILLFSSGAEPRWIRDSELAFYQPQDVGDTLRAVNDWAAARGLAAVPLFGTQWREINGRREKWIEVLVLKIGPTEFRDVVKTELGRSRFEDWFGRFRDAFQYASTKRYVTGVPTGHQAMASGRVVYGTQLLTSETATWMDAPGIVYGIPDRYVGPTTTPVRFRVWLARNRLTNGVWDCGPGTGAFGHWCGKAWDPAAQAGAVITSVTNEMTETLELRYREVGQDGRAIERGPVTVQGYQPTDDFDGAALDGLIVARIFDSTPPETLSVEVEYVNPPDGTTYGSPTPPPGPLTSVLPGVKYHLVNAAYLALTVDQNLCGSGARVIAAPATADSSQEWTFWPTGRGTYTIRSVSNRRVLDVEGSSRIDGAAIQVFERLPDLTSQEFEVEYAGEQWFRIVAVHSGKALGIAGDGRTSAPVEQRQWQRNLQQKWRLETTLRADPGFRVTCR